MAAGTESQRPQIAAMERGPGPARYQLPTMTGSEGHDATRRTWPTYSFGRRLGTCMLYHLQWETAALMF
jgi:hypothetical protein